MLSVLNVIKKQFHRGENMSIKLSRIKEILSKKAYKEFIEFMRGQTVEVGEDGKTAIFEDDFIRFVNKQGVID